jgi:hypothetical protein
VDKTLLKLKEAWLARWPAALALWSKFTMLREPVWCFTEKEAKREQLEESFAMIRLTDHAVILNLAEVQKNRLEDYGLEVMAHEIGHHVYCPADLSDQGRMLARMRRTLPSNLPHPVWLLPPPPKASAGQARRNRNANASPGVLSRRTSGI